MENLLRATLSKAFEAYLIGVTKPIQSNHMITGDAFNNILFSIIDTRLPLDNQLLLYQSYHLRDQGLAAAQKGDLINSERFFKGVETMLLSKKLARESFLLAKSYYEAGIAYLDYRNSNFDKATARIYEALACDVALEEEFGYSILHLHRLQLAHNLMRVYVRQAFLEEALNIGYQLLDYMEGKIVSLSIPTPWDSSKLKPLPKEQVNGMFIQVTYEIVLLLAGNDTMNTSEAFAGARSHTRAKSSESLE